MTCLDARVLEAYAQHESGTSFRTGTGYLLDGGLVLTAAHVLSGPNARMVVRRPGDRRHWRCSLVWSRYDEEGDDQTRVDAALLRIVEPSWIEPDGLPPLTWDRLVTGQQHVPVVLAGFPTGHDVRSDDDVLRFRDSAHASGTLDTRSVKPGGHLRLTLTHPIPSRPGSASRWKGASGTAVLVCGSLTGIVLTAEREPGGRWLEVLTVAELAADAQFRYHVGPIELGPAELRPILSADGPRPAYSPVSLLSPEVEAVRFHGRDELVDELAGWCDAAGAFSMRLIIGPGGQGKTRLARHLTTMLRGRGWSAGFLSERIDAAHLSVLGQVTTPLLVVVDYAEDRAAQLVHVARVLRETISSAAHAPVRLLLLARAAGDWWNRLRQDVALLRGFSPQTVISLPALEPSVEGRSIALRSSIGDLAARLDQVAAYAGFDRAVAHDVVLPDVSADRFSCALNLHMTALVALLQAADPIEVAKDEDDEAILLRHEQKFWKRTATGYGLSELDLMSRRQLVGVATLCQAEDQTEAHAVLDRLEVLNNSTQSFRDRVARWLASLYPAEHAYWGSLQPDRLGEYLVSTVIDAVPDLLEQLLPHASRPQALRALRTLARADIHRSGMAVKLRDLVAGHADPLAFIAIEAATTVEHPQPLRQAISALTGDGATDVDLLSRLYDATPLQSQALAQWATELAERLTDEARAAARDDTPPTVLAELAKRLNNYAIRLAAAGRHTEALEASQESVTHRRRLAKNGTAAELHGLATSLNTHGGSLTDTGRPAEALAAAEEVVRLSRKTAEFDPTGLALALHNLAIRQGDMGQLIEAVDSAEEALRLYRQLADGNPAAHLPNVALALDTYSICLSEAGRYRPAAAAAAGAVALYQKLAADLPDSYIEDVARALSSHSRSLTELGRHDEATGVAAESVRLYRKLTEARPDADPQWLADALTTYANCLSNAERYDESLALQDEVLAINRRRYESNPNAYGVQYVRALCDQAAALQLVGRDADATILYEEALPPYRQLTASLPTAYGNELSKALNNFAYCLIALDEPQQAVEVADEAASVCRQLAQHDPDPHRKTLAQNLRVRAKALQATGQASRALRSLDEAVALQRLAAETNPDVELAELVGMLHDHANLLSETGHRAGAAIAAEECVAVSRRLAQLDNEEYDPILAQALNTYAVMLSDAGRDSDMLPIAEEGHRSWQAFATREPDRFRSGFGISLHLLTVGLFQANRIDDARTVTTEHVRLFEKPAKDDPETYLPMYVGALADQALVLTEAGRAAEALGVTEHALKLSGERQEFKSDLAEIHGVRARAQSLLGHCDESLNSAEASLRTWRELVDADAVTHMPSLASMLRTHAELLATAGKRMEAQAAAADAVALYRELAETEPDAFGAELAKALTTQREVNYDH